MAINETTTGNMSAALNEAAQKKSPPPTEPMASPTLRSTFAFGSPIGKGMGSEYLKKIAEYLKAIYATADKSTIIEVIVVDNVNEPGSYFSLIIVAMKPADKSMTTVSAYPIVVEATASAISSIYENFNGQQIEITRTSGQAFDDKLSIVIANHVRKVFGKVTIHLVPGVVLPRSFDPENKVGMHMVALNAGYAAGTDILLSTPGFNDMDLTKEAKDSSLVINIGFMPNQIKNAVGEPMRSDVLINFSSSKRVNSNSLQSINSDSREIPISELSGFVDLVWNPSVRSNVLGIPQQSQMLPPGVLPSQKYSARLVLTNIATESSYTPASILMALSLTSSLVKDNNWMQAFRPSASSADIDYHDIGAMNIEANVFNEMDKNGFGTRVDTKKSTFTIADLFQYINSIISQGLIISMDCPEAGPQSWYQSMFSRADSGNKAETEMILEAANQLTGGSFQKVFPQGSPIFVDTGNIVHTGYWVDKTGTQRDIRDVDSIFVANVIGERNPQIISEWQNSFLRQDISIMQRLASRKKLITALTNETAVITGFARRVTFSQVFLEVLYRCIGSVGFSYRTNTPMSSSDMNTQRGFASFAGSALLMPNQNFINDMGTMNMPQNFMGSYNNTYHM